MKKALVFVVALAVGATLAFVGTSQAQAGEKWPKKNTVLAGRNWG